MQPRPYVGQTPVTPGWAGALRDEGVPEAPVRPSPTSHSQRRRFLEPRGPREGADGDTWGGGTLGRPPGRGRPSPSRIRGPSLSANDSESMSVFSLPVCRRWNCVDLVIYPAGVKRQDKPSP